MMLIKNKKIIFYIAISFIFTFVFCQTQKDNRIKAPLGLQAIKKDFSIQPRWVYLPKQSSYLQNKRLLREKITGVTNVLKQLLIAFREKKITTLGKLVHSHDGIYVDLKAHWTKEFLAKEIKSKRGYLYDVMLSEKEPSSVYQVLRSSSKITVDYYLEGDYCELNLDADQKSGTMETLNNPVFIYKSGQWYVYRLF